MMTIEINAEIERIPLPKLRRNTDNDNRLREASTLSNE